MTTEVEFEGAQVKLAVRRLFEESRKGAQYSKEKPLYVKIDGVNGEGAKRLALHHGEKKGQVVMWYEELKLPHKLSLDTIISCVREIDKKLGSPRGTTETTYFVLEKEEQVSGGKLTYKPTGAVYSWRGFIQNKNYIIGNFPVGFLLAVADLLDDTSE